MGTVGVVATVGAAAATTGKGRWGAGVDRDVAASGTTVRVVEVAGIVAEAVIVVVVVAVAGINVVVEMEAGINVVVETEAGISVVVEEAVGVISNVLGMERRRLAADQVLDPVMGLAMERTGAVIPAGGTIVADVGADIVGALTGARTGGVLADRRSFWMMTFKVFGGVRA